MTVDQGMLALRNAELGIIEQSAGFEEMSDKHSWAGGSPRRRVRLRRCCCATILRHRAYEHWGVR